MGSATIRRLALVAATLLLVTVWCPPSTVARVLDTTGVELVGLARTGASSAPAIRRQSGAGWWMAGRVDQGRVLVVMGVVALLSLLRLVPSATMEAVPSAPSPLARRRHVIALRAPPLRSCVPQ